MKIIGLTGGIASGKSTVSEMIRQMGIPVICADRLAHKVMEPGKPASKEIAAFFGPKVLFPDETIHRALLASIVFSSPLKRKKLNSIVHPHVISEMKREIKKLKKKKKEIVVLDIPLLFEERLQKLCDDIVVVYAPERVMAERLKKREGLSVQEIKKRFDSQMSIESKRKKADWVIDNSQSVLKTRKQVKKVLGLLSLGQ